MTANDHASANCDFLDRVIERRRIGGVELEFLHADIVDEADGTFIEQVWRAVALHSHCAPDSIPLGFCMRQDFRECMEVLLHGEASDSPQRRLRMNMKLAVRALREGDLTTIWALPDHSGLMHYDHKTIVDLEVFRDWANRVRLPVAGPWTKRGKSSAEQVGCILEFKARPYRADVAMDLDRQFGAEFLAGCPRQWDPMVRFCLEKHGMSRNDAIRLISFMDPRAEHRGTPVAGSSSSKREKQLSHV